MNFVTSPVPFSEAAPALIFTPVRDHLGIHRRLQVYPSKRRRNGCGHAETLCAVALMIERYAFELADETNVLGGYTPHALSRISLLVPQAKVRSQSSDRGPWTL
jgi:hypothetical protein